MMKKEIDDGKGGGGLEINKKLWKRPKKYDNIMRKRLGLRGKE